MVWKSYRVQRKECRVWGCKGGQRSYLHVPNATLKRMNLIQKVMRATEGIQGRKDKTRSIFCWPWFILNHESYFIVYSQEFGMAIRGLVFALSFLVVKWSEVIQLCLTLCDPMDYSLPGSLVHGIFQARVLEWVAISFSRGSSQPRDRTCVSCIVGRRFYSLSHQSTSKLIGVSLFRVGDGHTRF